MLRLFTAGAVILIVIVCIVLILSPTQTHREPRGPQPPEPRSENTQTNAETPVNDGPTAQPVPEHSQENGDTEETEIPGKSSADGVISGKVTFHDGSPAAGTGIVAVGFAGRGKASANSEGEYALQGLKPGRYTLAARLEGFARATVQNVEVEADEETGDIDFILLQGGTLEGALLEEDNGGVDGEVCLVLLREGPGAAEVYRAAAGEEGRFSIKAITPGRYRVETYAPDCLPVDNSHIEISDGEAHRIEIVCRRGGWISGTVLDERQEPVANAEVFASAMQAGGGGASAVSDDDGGFKLRALPEGRYKVSAMHADYRPTKPLIVAVQPGQGCEDISILLRTDAEGIIAGKVLSGNKPIQDATVTIGRTDGSDSTTTDFFGRFVFSGVEKGVRLTVEAPGYQTRELAEVPPGKSNLVIEIEPRGFEVSGKIVLDKDKVVPHVSVSAFAAAAEAGQERLVGAWPFDEGFPEMEFSIELPEGEYRLRFAAEGYEAEDRSLSVTKSVQGMVIKMKRLH